MLTKAYAKLQEETHEEEAAVAISPAQEATEGAAKQRDDHRVEHTEPSTELALINDEAALAKALAQARAEGAIEGAIKGKAEGKAEQRNEDRRIIIPTVARLASAAERGRSKTCDVQDLPDGTT